jgi:hypothetical protein
LPRQQRAQSQLPWDVVYFRASDGSVPAIEFLDDCPPKVEAEILATLEAVRKAPEVARAHGFLVKVRTEMTR